MSVVGGALNNGDLANDGTLSITGDWMNVDTYTPGNGVMILNGSDQQNIAHNGQDIYQLLIEGGGELKTFPAVSRYRTHWYLPAGW